MVCCSCSIKLVSSLGLGKKKPMRREKPSEQKSTWNSESKNSLGSSKTCQNRLKKNILGEIFRSLWHTSPFTQTELLLMPCACTTSPERFTPLTAHPQCNSSSRQSTSKYNTYKTEDRESTHAKHVTRISYRYNVSCIAACYGWCHLVEVEMKTLQALLLTITCTMCTVILHIRVTNLKQADLGLGWDDFVSESGQKQAEKLLENSVGFKSPALFKWRLFWMKSDSNFQAQSSCTAPSEMVQLQNPLTQINT